MPGKDQCRRYGFTHGKNGGFTARVSGRCCERQRRLKGLIAQRGVNDALVCPLSLEIYEDPVMAADGFSYERREIEAWFARGKRTSPKTNEELPHVMLVPNRDLRAMCQDFLDEVRQYEVS